MAKQPWLEEVERRLLAGKLPPEYVRRFLDELADHHDDLMEEIMRKEAKAVTLSRLGEPGQVADAAVAAYQQRTFLGRHPSAKFWVFGVSPVAAMVLVFVLACLGIAATGAVLDWGGLHLSGKRWLGGVDPAVLNWGFAIITTIVPALLLAFAYCKVAQRLALGVKWTLASCGALAMVAMLPFQRITLSDMPGKSLWIIGLRLPPSPSQWVQLLVPLLVGVWFLRSGRKRFSREDRSPTAA